VKLGICNEIFKDWNDFARTADFVKQTGYDGIEIAPFTFAPYVTEIPESTRRDIVRQAAEVDLEVLGIHWVFVGPEGVHLTHPDKAVRDFTAQYLIDLVHFCGDIGGKVIVFGSPKQRNVAEGLSYDEAFDNAREVFERALPACEQRDVTICMEQLTHLETNFCNTVMDTIDLIDAIGHSHFQLILDTKAMAFEEADRATLIRQCAPYLRHYHANDENLEGPGFGDVDFAPIFKALTSVDYSDYVSVEVFKFDPGPEAIATRSLEYMKRFV
jgi:sugar phosphate isomerase/epimerase